MKYIIAPNNLIWFNGWCSTFLMDVKATLKEDGWYVAQREIAAIGMVYIKLGDLKVEDFTEEVVVAWDTKNMGDFLKDVGDAKLNIVLKDNRFHIDAGKIKRKMTLVDDSSITIARRPKLENLLVAETTIDLADLRKAIKACKRLSDHATFACEGSVFKVKAEKKGGDEVLLETPMDGEKKGDCHSDFSLEYLENIAKLLQGKATIGFGTRVPIFFHDEVSEHSFADFYLAPRVEEE